MEAMMNRSRIEARVAVFIQARMGSTRLPGKVLMPLAGRPVLEHVIERVKASGVGEPFVVTTFSAKDLPIVAYCAEHGIRVFCGSENDVLDRFWQAAKLLEIEHVVRITADCPILDPEVVRRVVDVHLESGADYSSNVQVETFPDGLDAEVFSKASLKKAWYEAKLPSEREHVTPYIRKNPEIFAHSDVRNDEDLSGMRWTLDNSDDYEFLTAIFSELKECSGFGMSDVLRVLRGRPGIASINGGIMRNEGYEKSLREDTKELT